MPSYLSFSTLLSISAVITLVSFIAAYLLVQFRKTTIQILQENNAALTEQVGILEKAFQEQNLKISQLEASFEHLTSEYGGLRQVIDDALDRYFAKNPEVISKIVKKK